MRQGAPTERGVGGMCRNRVVGEGTNTGIIKNGLTTTATVQII